MNVHQPAQTGVHIGGPQDREEAETAAARAILAAHVPDPERDLCAVCLVHGPCRPANAAANRLVELGQPVCPPDRPTRPRRGWRDWIVPRTRFGLAGVSQPVPVTR